MPDAPASTLSFVSQVEDYTSRVCREMIFCDDATLALGFDESR